MLSKVVTLAWTAAGLEKAKAGTGEMVLTFPDFKDCSWRAVELVGNHPLVEFLQSRFEYSYPT